MITLKNICKEYKIGNKLYKILDDISIEFGSPGLVSILGPSGCGKTTLLNIIGGLDKASSGSLIVDNIDTNQYRSTDWDSYRNTQVGFVFQRFNLIEKLSVYSNVELALKLTGYSRKNRKNKVMAALAEVGLEKHARKKPNQLSGGEQQRVAIARAIVNNPDIILADEPTGALDSKNSDEVLKILKEISKKHLVIVVTHNELLANEYSDVILKMNDGKIYSTGVNKKDDSKNKDFEKQESNKKKKTIHMPIFTAFGLGIKNMYSKWLRTILTIIAGSIGIVALSLVITVSQGVNTYINEMQTNALSDYPIIIRSNAVVSTSGNIYSYREEYPTTKQIMVTKTLTNYEQVNNLDSSLVNYIDGIDKDSYTILNYNRSINMRIMRNINDEYRTISSSYMTELIDDSAFVATQYDVLEGKIPTEYNEVALVVDRYNSISSNILEYLRINNSNDYYSFDDILNVTYKLIENNNYYYYNEARGVYLANINSEEIYNNATVELKIVGIMREKENSSFPLYSTGLVYSPKLTDYVLNSSLNSDIVKAQLQAGLERNVRSGLPYEDSVGSTYTYTKEYLYQNDLLTLGADVLITRINIYSQSFENRTYIENYIKEYTQTNKISNVSYSDYMSTLTKEITSFIDVLSNVLLILALISVFVSSIMIAIITYISVIERTKEIGILRSVGARKIDIGNIFCAETFLIGLIAGIVGILLAYLLKNPINEFVQNVIKDSLNVSGNINDTNLIQFDGNLVVVLIFGSAILTLLSGLIPAIIASLKKPIDALNVNN